LGYSSEEFRSDREVVMKAVKKSVDALKYSIKWIVRKIND